MKKLSSLRQRTLDMTQGDPIRLILIFGLPLMVGNVFRQIHSIVDSMVVGRVMGDLALSAIGATSSLDSLLVDVASGLTAGCGILISQAFGAYDRKRLRQSIAGSFLICAGMTAVITLGCLLFLKPLMGAMNVPASVFFQAYSYTFGICGGLFATVLYDMLAALLNALGNSRTPLLCLMAGGTAKLVLEVLLVAVLKLGVIGAALATVLSQLMAALLCVYVLLQDYRDYLPDKSYLPVPKELLQKLLSTSLSMVLVLCVVDVGSIVFQSAVNKLGNAVIAAHAASRRCIFLFSTVQVALVSSLSTFVSQNYGAKRFDRIRRTVRQVMVLEILLGAAFCIVQYLFGRQLVQLITGSENPQIISTTVMAIRISTPFYPSLGLILCLRNTMQAMGQKKIPVYSSFLELGLKILASFTLIPQLGYLGACINEPIVWNSMMAMLLIAYLVQREKLFGKTSDEAPSRGTAP